MRTVSRKRSELALALISLAVAGCSGDGEHEDVGTASAPLTFSPAQSGSANQLGYSWSYGQPHVAMVPSSGNTCFLTGLHGSFTSAHDEVSIYNTLVNGVATWMLGGSRQSGAPGGRAFCFIGYPGAFAGVWSQSQAEVDLGSTAARTCFLTSVKGRFNVFPYNAAVSLTDRNGRWILGGSPAGTSLGLRVGATCADAVPFAGTHQTTRTSTGTSTMVTWIGSSDRPFGCALTAVSGYLNGGNHVETYVSRTSDGTRRWNLAETRNTGLLSVSAYCTM